MAKDGHFYSHGLRFQCTRCSQCCRLSPGFVFLSEEDLERIAHGLGQSTDAVVTRFCRKVSVGKFRRLSLIEKSNYDCIFWERGGCRIYKYRPLQCRSYPFWSSNLFSSFAWENVGRSCPGIGRGKLHSRARIEQWLRRRESEKLIALEDDESIKINRGA
jgi:Fe-S-cluster containining protein